MKNPRVKGQVRLMCTLEGKERWQELRMLAHPSWEKLTWNSISRNLIQLSRLDHFPVIKTARNWPKVRSLKIEDRAKKNLFVYSEPDGSMMGIDCNGQTWTFLGLKHEPYVNCQEIQKDEWQVFTQFSKNSCFLFWRFERNIQSLENYNLRANLVDVKFRAL